MKKFKRISIDPDKMGGVPCIRDLRMPVSTIVTMVAAGMEREQILKQHPDLEAEDITEALEFAAHTLKERTTPVSFK